MSSENLALHLPVSGQRENLTQRLRRWLKNQAITQERCYLPLVENLLQHWPHREISLVMDRTDLGQTWSILMLCAAYRHRALPLTWQIYPFGGTGYEQQEALLASVAPLLPPWPQRRITFYGDSEFRAVDLQLYCRDQGWHWYVGLKSDILYYQAAQGWRPCPHRPLYCSIHFSSTRKEPFIRIITILAVFVDGKLPFAHIPGPCQTADLGKAPSKTDPVQVKKPSSETRH